MLVFLRVFACGPVRERSFNPSLNLLSMKEKSMQIEETFEIAAGNERHLLDAGAF